MTPPLFQSGPASDPVYLNIRDLSRGEALRKRFEGQWQRYSAFCGDRPEHFLNDAREHFHARAWEIQVGCMLLDNGFVLERPGSEAPDHLVRLGQQRLWIEDTVVHPGMGPDAVRELPLDGEMHPVERDPMLLRYTQAIRAKWEQWTRFILRKTVALDDPFVIALNGGLLTWANVDRGLPDIVRALFGLGEATWTWDPSARAFEAPVYPYRPEVRKLSGAPVRLEFFSVSEYSSISGLLFSGRKVWDSPASGGDDLLLVHNPYARNPLPRGSFQFGSEWWFDVASETVHWSGAR